MASQEEQPPNTEETTEEVEEGRTARKGRTEERAASASPCSARPSKQRREQEAQGEEEDVPTASQGDGRRGNSRDRRAVGPVAWLRVEAGLHRGDAGRHEETVQGASTEGRPAAKEVTKTLAKERKEEKKEQEEKQEEAWWSCPHCEFEVSRSWGSSKRTRLRQQHLRHEHQGLQEEEELGEAPGGKKAVTPEETARRMQAITQARVDNLKTFAKEHKTHDLELLHGFTLHCGKCGFKGMKGAVPKACKMMRGGQRLGAEYAAVRVPGDGFCLWHSLCSATKTEASARDLRAMVCQQMKEEGAHYRWKGRTLRDWVDDEMDISWVQYLRRILRGRTWPGVLELQAAARLLQRRIEVYIKDASNPLRPWKRIVEMPGGPMAPAGPITIEFQDGCH